MIYEILHKLLLEYLFLPFNHLLNTVTELYVHYRNTIVSWLLQYRLIGWILTRFRSLFISVIKVGYVPQHISFIMDGNRRYAKSFDLPVKKGHEAGGLNLLSLVYSCKQMGVKCVSAYAFSIENFNRSPEEVNTLTTLFAEKLDDFAARAVDYTDPLYGTRLKIVGDFSYLSSDMVERIRRVEALTQNGDDFILYICYPYTSRNDIYHSIFNTVDKKINNINTKQSTDNSTIHIKDFSNSMYFDSFSDKCDLLVRTSGHNRLSDYMLWQTHESSTIEFTDSLWPDFSFFSLYWMIIRWSFF
ncbi:hypothetical protein TPHA_0G02950 [Tetrapisispora phaffii CBS 4417]|uniref:Alkyl transferase n=1 Tax=Tetrapisispora phaffii (strain ATCC 24235 / CBS 4417 / NBRC 1672 / NRRL Y-8282 / UCD 70-5) TaxID=1071381 RepID=G8BW58_TETPH|nr:hypothetical protein TPHA_0G02950 [Tetrapisispora phaffii CBS 4417]CCE64136.1 hypothetical protein TPHA_0G02950 [Tetrapisispora phaffii CBS 4417]